MSEQQRRENMEERTKTEATCSMTLIVAPIYEISVKGQDATSIGQIRGAETTICLVVWHTLRLGPGLGTEQWYKGSQPSTAHQQLDNGFFRNLPTPSF